MLTGYIDELMERVYKCQKDDFSEEIPAPMTSLYKKPADPSLLKENFRSRFKK